MCRCIRHKPCSSSLFSLLPFPQCSPLLWSPCVPPSLPALLPLFPLLFSVKAQRSCGGSEPPPSWNKHTEINSSREREEGKRPDDCFSTYRCAWMKQGNRLYVCVQKFILKSRRWGCVAWCSLPHRGVSGSKCNSDELAEESLPASVNTLLKYWKCTQQNWRCVGTIKHTKVLLFHFYSYISPNHNNSHLEMLYGKIR